MPNDSMIGRYLAARERAAAAGDAGVVREIDFQLQRIGYSPDAPVTEAMEARADADARPAGRPTARRAKTEE